MTCEQVLEQIEEWFANKSFITALQLADIVDERPGLDLEGRSGAPARSGRAGLTFFRAWIG